MNPLATWEKLLLGVLALVVILWFSPGIKSLLRQSQDTPKDWPAVLAPLVLVIAFVIMLILFVQ